MFSEGERPGPALLLGSSCATALRMDDFDVDLAGTASFGSPLAAEFTRCVREVEAGRFGDRP